MRNALALLTLALVVGCATPAPGPAITASPRMTAFDPAEYAPFRGSGTGRIDGQVFLRTMGGDVKPGAGSIVTLNPATTHGREWFEMFMSAGLPAAGDPRAAEFARRAQCGASGSFVFTGLRPGRYCLVSGVVWSTGVRMTGSTVGAMVDVQDGETARAILTR